MAGLALDPWQQLFMEHALAYRPDGTWAAREVGLVVSRQNGKGSILEALELASLFLLDEEVCIHSAHLFDTSLEAFNRIMILIEQTPDLLSMVKRVVRSHGEEGIEVFREGKKRRLRFKTRTKGGGRGLTGDRVIVDEAMYFAAQTAAALLPVVSARPNAQLVYTGSAGDKESEHFGRVRQRGVEGTDPRLCFLEWSIDACTDYCPPGCQDHDRTRIEHELYKPGMERELERAQREMIVSYAKANPGLGIRISVESCESERVSMSVEGFSAERLGVGDWPVEGEAYRVIDSESWMQRYDELSAPMKPLAFSIDVTPDRKHSCIAVAGGNGEGAVHAEITAERLPPSHGGGTKLDHRPGTAWVVPRAIAIWKKNKAPFVIDRAGQAGAFVDELEAAGVKVLCPTAREYAQGCGHLYSGIVRRGVIETGPTGPLREMLKSPTWFRHSNQPALTAAVAGAEKRDLADLWAWDKRNASVDITPLVAVTNACWGHFKGVHTKKPKPMAAWG